MFKDISSFSKNKDDEDGQSYYCNECYNKIYTENNYTNFNLILLIDRNLLTVKRLKIFPNSLKTSLENSKYIFRKTLPEYLVSNAGINAMKQ